MAPLICSGQREAGEARGGEKVINAWLRDADVCLAEGSSELTWTLLHISSRLKEQRRRQRRSQGQHEKKKEEGREGY